MKTINTLGVPGTILRGSGLITTRCAVCLMGLLLIFSGNAHGQTALNWTQAAPGSASPSARSGHGMVFDNARQKVIVFGGVDVAGNFLNDMWQWDLASQSWSPVVPATNDVPVPRANFAMAYDVNRSKIVLYGGNVPVNADNNVGIVGDTWEFDSATLTWTLIPADHLVYVGLWGAQAAYDPNLRQVILFGGQPYWGIPENGGTYAWSGTAWTLVASTPGPSYTYDNGYICNSGWDPSGPAGRVRHMMATDTKRSRVVLFGGETNSCSDTVLGDTWEWNGTSWTQIAVSGNTPSPRVNSGFVYDSALGASVLFGGSSGGSGVLGDTWEWGGGRWAQQQPAASPSPRTTSMAYDAANPSLVIFGGTGASTLDETWFVTTPATTTTLLTSSLNPATAGDTVTFTATVSSSAGAPTGTVTFLNGSTRLDTISVGSSDYLGGGQPPPTRAGSGATTLVIEDADTLGAGNFPITAQYTPDTTNFGASRSTIIQTVSLPGVALTNGNNTLTGNQAVSGTVNATNFVGDGSGLTNVTAAHANSADTATTANFANSAATADTANTATNALSLGSILAINFARLDIGNSFSADQTFSGGVIFGSTGYINLPNLDPSGGNGGWILSGQRGVLGVSADNTTILNTTSLSGGRLMITTRGSEAYALLTVLNSGQVGIGTTTPRATLEVNGTALFDNPVTFAAGQTFPGAGTGTITGVTAGPGLSGGGTGGNVLLNNTGALSFNGRAGAISSAAGDYFFSQIGGSAAKNQLPTTSAYIDQANSFANTQTITGGNLALDNTNGAGTAGVITLGGYPFLHNFGSGNTFLGLSAGNFTMTGSGNTVTGARSLVSNTTGVYNTVDGWSALDFNTTGYLNTALGAGAGHTLSGANANTTGSYNTFIGASSGPGIPSSASLQNATAIGANAVVSANNALVLGSINGVNGASASVNVGIGTSNPAQALDVVGNVKLEGSGNGVIFPDGTMQTTAASDGTITGVTAGSGLIGGGTTGNVNLSIPPAGVTDAMLANPSLSVNAGAGLTGGGSVALGGTTTLSLASAACGGGSAVTALPLTCAPFAGLGANAFTGNQTMPSLTAAYGNFTGNLAANSGSFSHGLSGVGFTIIRDIYGNTTDYPGITGVSNTAAAAIVGSNNNYGPGVSGYAVSGSGIFALTASTSATAAAGMFSNTAANNAGNILLGQSAGVTMFSVDGKGDVAATGSVTIGSGGTAITKHLSLPVTPNFANQNSLACTSAAFTLTGAADGDTLAMGVPNSMMNVDVPLVYTAWVSAPDTVTVRVCNFSGAKQKVASTGSIRIDLWKH
jgi:hypothetical protein